MRLQIACVGLAFFSSITVCFGQDPCQSAMPVQSGNGFRHLVETEKNSITCWTAERRGPTEIGRLLKRDKGTVVHFLKGSMTGNPGRPPAPSDKQVKRLAQRMSHASERHTTARPLAERAVMTAYTRDSVHGGLRRATCSVPEGFTVPVQCPYSARTMPVHSAQPKSSRFLKENMICRNYCVGALFFINQVVCQNPRGFELGTV